MVVGVVECGLKLDAIIVAQIVSSKNQFSRVQQAVVKCQPPAETKVDFFFLQINSQQDSYYDIGLVHFNLTLLIRQFIELGFNNSMQFQFDGYSLASDITLVQNVNDISSIKNYFHSIV